MELREGDEATSGDSTSFRRIASDVQPTETIDVPGRSSPATFAVADRVAPLLRQLGAGARSLRFVFWDGSATGPESSPGRVVLRSPRALTRLIWSPNELGLARAFITGDIDLEGDLYGVLREMVGSSSGRLSPASIGRALWTTLRLGAFDWPPPRPEEEAQLSGWLHSKRRDAEAITHHYDVGNDFYKLLLGPAMTYSCALFTDEETTLLDAQRSKHDLICKKLGLNERPGARLLDVGCGWGSMAIHAAGTYECEVVAITISPSQAEEARARVRAAGLGHLVEIRLEDYRELRGETFDAISSIGMFEHVGSKRMGEYFDTLRSLLAPQGRLLNHAISTPGGYKMRGRTFMNRYVFPDGELIDVAQVVRAMERSGFEVRDVESLREHYAQTLYAWVDNLERSWDEAVHLVGEPRSRVWLLYMAGCANGFASGGVAIHQVLGIALGEDGVSGMPRTRTSWV